MMTDPNDTPTIDHDLDAIRALLIDCALPVADLDGRSTVEFLTTRDGAKLTGVIGLEPLGPVGLLRSLAVAPAARGRGCAVALVAAVERRAREHGIETLYLLTNTAADFFTARGYHSVRRDDVPAAIRATAEFTSLCPDDAAVMLRHLGNLDP